ncbi:Na+ dependent nucleoside transporter [Flavobacteriaceae bacterium]|jgi:CNT family concentrative nucleoside transporter|nr:Na+ dependent nucleoside transporter [Flavobacteriaceae bacterium]MBT6952907.1 Na+ dependent nucleoside transporter [Flavobacteriaceae bacterium]MDA9183805.1 Na+ dependent nucleoside transporter [Flavobacteriaceae bacterium]MDB4267080.1 Na+ dependent nucleoside transporter [Flavobacteriaceae bacterium]MDB4270169.1 Na+ dependent nucleoside transporter [Flavobacteriaceae bacterium]|tara:strand:+ start:4922 stop:6241 length:1320 start_codon:yes stop_codon:yes gene_type:complete
MELIPSAGISVTSLFRGVLGMGVLLLIAVLFSTNRKKIAWKTVGLGLLTQIIIAIGVLKISLIKRLFETLGNFFIKILDYTGAGTKMLLGEFGNVETYGFIFVFQALPVIIFFSALTSILYYFGVIQKVVGFFAWGLTKLFKISGAESLSVAGNIFLGQTEAPLLIKAYLEKMNRSEIFLVMVGGMATVAGSVLGAYIGFLGGNDPVQRLEFAKSLLAASVMAAPGAVVIAKIIYPQTEEITTDIEVSHDKIGENFLSAISIGTGEGIKMAVNVAAMLLVFIALIALVNNVFSGVGDLLGLNVWVVNNTVYDGFSIEFVLGYLFAPLMWLVGVAREDMTLMGQLLGIKLVASEFVGYTQLVDLKNSASSLHFTYQKSVVMATYMLCGFANFASIGIQVGGIGIIAPKTRKLLTELGFKAMIAGSLVSLMSATIAGIILG